MHTNGQEYGIAEIVEGVAEKVIGAAYEVANVLGSGFPKRSMSGLC